tara:strand:+ start:1306 stop:2043 length:738 start_codon:yes stop_codon:yes gene_type:complete
LIYGELPTKRVVYAACDKEYFKEHAPSLVYSLNDIGKDIHIHICDPDASVHNIEAVLKKDIDVQLTCSYNDIGATPIDARAYYSCLRFMMTPNILPSANEMLIVDVDCVFMNDFEWPTTDTGYFPRQPLEGTVGWEADGTRVAAGCVYLTAKAMNVANAINERIKEGPMRWFIDQIALSEVFARVDEKDITKFDGNFMDWEFVDDTVIWTGKGPRKYENQKYLAAKKSFNRLGLAADNLWRKSVE